MMRPRLPWLLALVLLAAALYPTLARRREAARVLRQLDVAVGADGVVRRSATVVALSEEVSRASSPSDTDPALMVRVEELGPVLASWQTIGGCGSSGATGSAGIKWIGRGATGGLFNVQVQGTYSQLGSAPNLERDFFVNTLITKDIGDDQKWNAGINIPYVYKYLDDPFMLYSPQTIPPTPGVDVTNAGLGDISLQGTRRFGSINNNALTLVLGLPTGTYKAQATGLGYLHQQQQLGFGKVTGAAILDHTMDQVWGVVILGGVAAWRGGQNSPLDNYRAPSASGYAYAGYFLGPFVPAVGLSLTGFTGHDRDMTQEENSGLFLAAANFSLEWSTDWVALVLGASVPYQYVGHPSGGGVPPPTWGWGTWLVALGLAVSPF
jgi:hypothetical protein